MGIDIGTSSVRIVELEKNGKNFKLTNYGEIKSEAAVAETFRVARKAMAFFSVEEVSETIKKIIAQANIKTRQCAFSIPDFSTFFTNFKLPPMTEKEIPEAVMFEARQHIPLPLESVTVDWQLVGGNPGLSQDLEIVLAAIPNEIVEQYKEIAKAANLEVESLDAEVFGLIEALVADNETKSTCLVDIGTQSTVCSICEGKVLKTSHSFDIAGNHILERALQGLPFDQETVREIKKNYGLKFFSAGVSDPGNLVNNAFLGAMESIAKEVGLMLQGYARLGNKEVSKITISGGAALIPGVMKSFKERFGCEVDIADPFTGINFPSMLTPELQKIAPVYSVAVGMAKRGLAASDSKKKASQKRQ